MWFPKQQIELVAWPEYRDVLAVWLTNDQFETVSQAVTRLAYLQGDLSDMREREENLPTALGPTAVKRLRVALGEATDAYNALDDLAGHAKIDGLLPDAAGRPPGVGMATPRQDY